MSDNQFYITRIDNDNIELLEEFVDKLGNSKTFRYFQKRGVTTEKHIRTVVITNRKDKPVGYGHLRNDKGVWLGCAVLKQYRGKGIGGIILNDLINFTRRRNIPYIFLTVDSTNKRAVSLYKKYGFQKDKQIDGVIYMKKLV